jgi:hypothetical protein
MACDEQVEGPGYKCSTSECNFRLHKSCAQLPRQIQCHPSHPNHVLILSLPRLNSSNCNACGKWCRTCLFYTCDECDFNLDPRVLPAHELIILTIANTHSSHSLSRSASLVKPVVKKAQTSPPYVPYVTLHSLQMCWISTHHHNFKTPSCPHSYLFPSSSSQGFQRRIL